MNGVVGREWGEVVDGWLEWAGGGRSYVPSLSIVYIE